MLLLFLLFAWSVHAFVVICVTMSLGQALISLLLAGFVLIPRSVWLLLSLPIDWHWWHGIGTNLCLTAGGRTSCSFCCFAKRKHERDALICSLSLLQRQERQRTAEGISLLWCDCSRVPTGKLAMGGWLATYQVLSKSGFITTFCCCCLKLSFLPSCHSVIKIPGKKSTLPSNAGLFLSLCFKHMLSPFSMIYLMRLSVPLAAPSPVFPALLSGTASREMTMFAFVYLSLTVTGSSPHAIFPIMVFRFCHTQMLWGES